MSERTPAAPPPDDLPALRGWLAARPDVDQLRPIAIREIVVGSDALRRLPDLLSDLDAPARVLLVQDAVPYRRASDDLKPLVGELASARGRAVELCVLQAAADGLVHADLDNVALVRSAIGGRPTTVVALGSGSVCDVAKHACPLAD